MTETDKTAVLLSLIDALCDVNFPKHQNAIGEWINKLNEVYSDDYRHTYSDIFFKIQNIMSNDMSNNVETNTEVLEILGENLNVLGEQIKRLLVQNNDNVSYHNTLAGFKKFSDHIKLEIGRYNFIKSRLVNKPSSSIDAQPGADHARITQIRSDVDSMRPIVAKAQQELDGIDEKLESNKISSITTLTIFSAVILAFSGGITFESGIFKGMVESSAYRLVFTIALSGFILFNTIFALLYLVGKMAGKRISTKCKYLAIGDGEYKQCQSCGDGYCTKECSDVSIACRIFHKYSYVLVIDIVLLYVLYSDFFLWLSNGVLLDRRFYLSQCFLLFVFVASIIIHFARKHSRLKRMKLHYKVIILRDIVEPKEQNPACLYFYDILSKIFCGTSTKSVKDSFLEMINNKDKDSALEDLDAFVDEYLISDYRLSKAITRREYKIDRKNWLALQRKLLSISSNDAV